MRWIMRGSWRGWWDGSEGNVDKATRGQGDKGIRWRGKKERNAGFGEILSREQEIAEER
jgi:hypothetical protein